MFIYLYEKLSKTKTAKWQATSDNLCKTSHILWNLCYSLNIFNYEDYEDLVPEFHEQRTCVAK